MRMAEIGALSKLSSSGLEGLVSAVTEETDPATSAAAIQSCRCIETIVQAIQESCRGEENISIPNGDDDSLASLSELLDAIRVILGVGRVVQEDFADHGGAKKLMITIDNFLDISNEGNCQSDSLENVGRAAKAIVVWCKGFEAGKVLLMADDAHIQLTKCLEKIQKIPKKSSEKIKCLCNVCDAIRSLCTGDDVEVAASKAFTHSRMMGEAGAHHCLVSCLREFANEIKSCSVGVNPVPSICNVLRAIGANDEICQEIANDGAIDVISSFINDIVDKATFLLTVKAVFGLLRQLAKSDANKATVIGRERIMEAVDRSLTIKMNDDDDDEALKASENKSQNNEQKLLASVREQIIGMLVSLSLRNPEASTRFCDDGIVAATINAMRFHSNHSGVQRQSCMMIRNCVVRCPELRPTVLSFGAEDVIRKARIAWPDQCKDVGTAALRDLGLENYNDD